MKVVKGKAAATKLQLLGVDDSGSSNIRVPGDHVVVVDTHKLKALSCASSLAVCLLGEVGIVRGIPSGKRAEASTETTEVDVALVARAPARGRSGSWAVAGKDIELLAARECGSVVEVEGKLALLALGLRWVGEGQESGDVVAIVACGLGDQTLSCRGDGTVADIVLPDGGGGEERIIPSREGSRQTGGGSEDSGDKSLEEHLELVGE